MAVGVQPAWRCEPFSPQAPAVVPNSVAWVNGRRMGRMGMGVPESSRWRELTRRSTTSTQPAGAQVVGGGVRSGSGGGGRGRRAPQKEVAEDGHRVGALDRSGVVGIQGGGAVGRRA